jgi:glyoxylase-like metal-dependent hydrolase (beta-lactamase superfamily II)
MVSASTSQFVDSRRIGDATITIISEGILPWAPRLQVPEAEWRRAMPEADENGVVQFGLNLAHIQIGDASILVDPGFDDPSPSQPETWPGLIRSPGLQVALRSLGVQPEQITHVLITHTHGDHYAGVTVKREGERAPRYPHARYFVGRRDWEESPQREKPDSLLVNHFNPLARLGLVECVDAEREIVSGVTMLASPGESSGHCIVRVQSVGETFYYLGDLFHHACEIVHPDWAPLGRDPSVLLASRQRLMAEAVASRATIVFTHEQFPAWGRIVATEGGYGWER